MTRDQLEQVERALMGLLSLCKEFGISFYRTEAEEALALIRTARAHSGATDRWLPIENAPKDGTEVILYHPPEIYEGKEYPARVTSGAWCEWPATETEPEGANWCSWDGGFREESPPTRWRPLPLPPGSPPAPQTDEWTAGAEAMQADCARYTLKHGSRLGSVNLAESIASLPIPRKEPRT